jgi:hypothetical protein
MLRRTIVARVGAFSRFMRETKNHPNLQGLSIPARGKALGKMYRELSKADLAALKARAATTTAVPRAPKMSTTREPTAYNLFVKKHLPTQIGAVPERMKAVAKLWKAHKK